MDLFAVARLFRKAYDDTDGCGATHILVADGNVDDGALDFCETQAGKPLLASEIELISVLRTISERDRSIAYYLGDADQYNPPLNKAEAMGYAISMAEQDIADAQD